MGRGGEGGRKCGEINEAGWRGRRVFKREE